MSHCKDKSLKEDNSMPSGGAISVVKQSFAKECDINNIVARYQKTGVIDHVARYRGNYGDFIGHIDYQSSLNKVLEADEMFNSLPSSIRNRFSNNPVSFLEFCQDPSNLDEMKKMGLVKPEVNVNPEVKEEA